MSAKFDCVVLGLGGIGSAALYYAARRGWKVLGLDQFEIAHGYGSSHGQSRIIRQAYFEHPSYVPLTFDAYTKWREIESELDSRLLIETGLLQVGWPDRGVIKGVIESAAQHHLPIESLTSEQCRIRFPMFRVPDDQTGIFEKCAGILRVEKCVAGLVELARRQGAELRTGHPLSRVAPLDDSVEIFVGEEKITARRAIVCLGPWSTEWQSLLGAEAGGLRVVRKHQYWFDFAEIPNDSEAMPVYLFETDQGCFYGFPRIDSKGYKVAEHSGGEPIEDVSGIDRAISQSDLDRVERFLAQRIRSKSTRKSHSVCMYTMTPDEHFWVDLHPQFKHIAFAAGFSGHGFKFAPVIGEYLADLLEGKRDQRLAFLKTRRPASQ